MSSISLLNAFPLSSKLIKSSPLGYPGEKRIFLMLAFSISLIAKLRFSHKTLFSCFIHGKISFACLPHITTNDGFEISTSLYPSFSGLPIRIRAKSSNIFLASHKANFKE